MRSGVPAVFQIRPHWMQTLDPPYLCPLGCACWAQRRRGVECKSGSNSGCTTSLGT